MKKSYLLVFGLLLLTISSLKAQDTLYSNRALNFPFKKYGISLGNSREFSGIRFNLADKNVKKINGLNVTFWYKVRYSEVINRNATVNGISAGMVPMAGTMQPLNFGILGLYSKNQLNGLSVGGLFAYSDQMNGLTIGGLGLGSKMINGLVFGGFLVHSQIIQGISLSPVFVFSENAIRGLTIAGIWAGNGGKKINLKIDGITIAGLFVKANEISGASISPGFIRCYDDFNGFSLSGIGLSTGAMRGLSVAGIANVNQKQRGLSIALVNTTKELHGLQLGLINYAGNNGKGLKVLPVINMHLGKKNR